MVFFATISYALYYSHFLNFCFSKNYTQAHKKLELVPVLLDGINVEEVPTLSYLRPIATDMDGLQAVVTRVSTQLCHWLKTGECADIFSPVPVSA